LGSVYWQTRRGDRDQTIQSESADLKSPLLIIAAAIFYLVAAEHFGFVITAAALLVGLLLCFRVRPSLAIGLGLALSVVVYQVFAIGLRVPLPRGLLGW
jgi:hypothetical protein